MPEPIAAEPVIEVPTATCASASASLPLGGRCRSGRAAPAWEQGGSVTNGSRPEVISVLRRFVHGQLTFEELQGFVRSKNFGWLDELLDGIQLGEGDYAELALDESALARSITEYVAGRCNTEAFADWSFETYRIFASGAYPSSRVYSPSVEVSLLLSCLISECESRSRLEGARGLAHRILEALERGTPIPSEMVVRRVLQGLPSVDLVTRPRPEPEAEPIAAEHWVDLALVSSPSPDGVPDLDDCWFTPISVTTRSLWRESPPEGSWQHPENDRMHRLRERYPHLDLDRHDPMYFVAPDGLAEIVLGSESLDEEALHAAVRLFCLGNRVRRSTLDGILCYPTREDR